MTASGLAKLREWESQDTGRRSLQAHSEDRDCDNRRVKDQQVDVMSLPGELEEVDTQSTAGERRARLPIYSEAKVVLAMLQSVTASRHGMGMARSGHKKAPRRNPPANEGRRYRLYPSSDADQAMTGWGHTRRAIRNIALEQRIIAWRYMRTTVRSYGQTHDLTELRQEYDWVRDLPAQAAQAALADVDSAYQNFWNPAHPAGFPTFEKRSGTLRFFLPGQALEVRRLNRHWGEVRLPKLGWQRFRMSRALGGSVANATFTKKAGVWRVSFGVRVERPSVAWNGKPGCGVDFGVACSAFVSDEDEPRLMAPTLTEGEKQRLLGLERRKARQITYANKHNQGRYSKRLRRTINEIAKLKARQAGRRLDLTHKLTTDLAKNHGYVGREDLAVKNMTASAKGTIEEPGTNVAAKAGLNRSILDNIPGERARQLAYKATWYGSVDLAVPAPGTSQTCPECHERDPLSRKRCGRLFACVHCGYQGHADKVASIEIDRRAGELLARIVGEALVITGGHPVNSTGRGTRKVTPSQSPRAKGASVNRPQGHGPSTSAAA